MGIEPQNESDLPADQVRIEGLGNSIMLAAPNSSFIRHWLEQYRTFDSLQWNTHSVQRPFQIAKDAVQLGLSITVLDRRAFFTPCVCPCGSPDERMMWDDRGLNWVHGTLPDTVPGQSYEYVERQLHGRLAPDQAGWSFETSGQFAYHLWSHALRARCSVATDGDLRDVSQLSLGTSRTLAGLMAQTTCGIERALSTA